MQTLTFILACNNTCENGELNGDTCECSCDPNWTGADCSGKKTGNI